MSLERPLPRPSPKAKSLVDRLTFRAESQSDEVAFVSWDGADEEDSSLRYRQLYRRATAIAARFKELGNEGERVLLLYPPGLEFVSAFLGCLFAGAAAVPALPPRRNRNLVRIQAISNDAKARTVLTVREVMEGAESLLDATPCLKQLQWLASEEIDDELSESWRRPDLQPDTLAVVQYTSGSTGRPKGVMLSHANLVKNCELINYGFEPTKSTVGFSWLPTYHDMGLVGGVLKPLWCGRPGVLMPPMAFLQKPVRWLRGVDKYRVTISGGPNFAYALCNDKVTSDQCQGLDLSSWEVAYNGAEPIRADTLERFAEKFAPYGFRPEALYPCYGMAETTLIVTGGKKQARPIVRAFDGPALEDHRIVATPRHNPTAKQLVGCGQPLPSVSLQIVDPETAQPLGDNRIGEIWVQSASVGQGYWNKTTETRKTFEAHLAGASPEIYLRTGDLGFVKDGELFVTGRCKDLMIIHGRNLYPHDIELTVEKAHRALRPDGGAAFTIEVHGEEQLVVVHEVQRQHRGTPHDEILAAIRDAVWDEHEVTLHSIYLLRTGKLPKTSSGKVQRRLCRESFRAGELESIAQWSPTESFSAHPATAAASSTATGNGVATNGAAANGSEAASGAKSRSEKPKTPTPNPSPEDGGGAFGTGSNLSPEDGGGAFGTGSNPSPKTGQPEDGGGRIRRGSKDPRPAAAGTPGGTALRRAAGEIEAWLIRRIAERNSTLRRNIGIHDAFSSFGLDSVALVELTGELEDWLGESVSPTLVFSYPTIAALSAHLAAETSDRDEGLREGRPHTHEPIAIVGIGCRFPHASGPEQFWSLLRDGVDAVGEVPPDRWNVDAYHDPDPNARGKIVTRRGGFLDQVDQFDAPFFSLSPREVQVLDPQQRLLLEVAWETLEHAGHSGTAVQGSRTGVFVGIGNCDYARMQSLNGGEASIDVHTGTGTLNSVAAGRLAYFLGLTGPTLAVDTACSSALVAVHLAMQSLRNGECGSALAGGVNLILEPTASVALSAMRALSPSGKCRTFDEEADGYVRGEGCGMILLKRLSDALQDGDRVIALLRGSATNHDGRSNGLTAPHGPSQEALLRSALSEASVEPNSVSYVEAHGTGTSLGDPIEVEALEAVFGEDRTDHKPLLIGSVKTNIGHLEASAGIAGLIKVALSMQYGQIPPSLNFENPNPYIPWDHIPIQVVSELTDWPAGDGNRLAGVSSFGFSGTNAHVILEEPPRLARAPSQVDRPQHVLVLSGRTKKALSDLAGQYGRLLGADRSTEGPPPLTPPPQTGEGDLGQTLTPRPQTGEGDLGQTLKAPADELADVCFTAAAGRTHFAHRVAVLGATVEQCRERLQCLEEGRPAAGLLEGTADDNRRPQIAFLFTGQGSQYPGMGRRLYATQPTFRRVLDECDRVLRDEWDRPLTDVLFAQEGGRQQLDETAYTQPALFALEMALFGLWESWGIRPDVMLGHSVGEYAAACAAGVFSLEDGLKLTAARGRLMQSLPNRGAMCALAASEDRVLSAIEPWGDELSIAAFNGPLQTVIAGTNRAVDAVTREFASQEVRGKMLKTSCAFHSALLDPILDAFEEVCEKFRFAEPTGKIVSNLSGRSVTTEMNSPAYWRRHMREPVRFAAGLRATEQMGISTYVEIGPHPVLTSTAAPFIEENSPTWLPSLREGDDDWHSMTHSLAKLYIQGATVDWYGFDRDYVRRHVNLPTYPFQRQRYWIDVPTGTHEPERGNRDDHRSTQANDRDMQQAFYEIHWQPKSRLAQSLERRPADSIPPPASTAQAVRGEIDRVTTQINARRYRDLSAALDQLCVRYVGEAFAELGLQSQSGQDANVADLARQMAVAPQHHRFFGHLLQMLRCEGLLGRRGPGRAGEHEMPRRPMAAAGSAKQLHAELIQRYPECDAKLNLLRQCGRQLAPVLAGRTDPLDVLFPAGSSELLEAVYRDSPFARSLNALLTESVMQMLADVPGGRTIKVLEIGGGTGSTTSQLLPRLPAERTEYVFTDVSELFTTKAAERFRGYPFVRFDVLDIEIDPLLQGFARHEFDLVIAANVLHATRRVDQAVEHIRHLLVPHGGLVLLEGTMPQRWLDLIFGMTEGWWRFEESDVRQQHPLLSAEAWNSLLTTAGFASSVAMPGEPPTDSDQLRSPQTVIVAQNGGGPQRPEEASSHRQVGETLPSATDHRMRISDAAATGDLDADGSWLIIADQMGVGEALAHSIETLGGDCVLAICGDAYRQLQDGRFEIRSGQLADIKKVLAEAWQLGRPACRGVIHLASLDAASVDDLTTESLDHAQTLGCTTATHLVRALVESGWSELPRCWFVTAAAQSVGADRRVPGIAQAPLWGLARVLPEENPQLWGGLIDLDPQSAPHQMANCLLAEVLTPDGEDQIAYRHDQRYVARLEHRPNRAATSVPWRADASYLITGGLGELGLTTARWMVEQGARTLILLGRSPFPARADWEAASKSGGQMAERIEAIGELEASGARIRIATADVADAAALSNLWSELEAECWPPIRGVVHAAGVAAPQMMAELEADQLTDVLRPKVTGSWLIHRALADARLDFFISFSSGATLLGSPMLGSYAAANAFLDALAHHRRAEGRTATSINWGFWDEVGMVARFQRTQGRGFAPQGMKSFSPAQGVAAMQQLIEQQAIQTAVMPVDWVAWGESHPAARHASLLCHLMSADAVQPSAGGDDAAAGQRGGEPREAGQEAVDQARRNRILALPSEARHHELQAFLKEQLSTVFRIPASNIDPQQPLNDLGIDSLMAVELRNQVKARLGIVIPIANLLEEPCIEELADSMVWALTTSDDQLPKMTSAAMQEPAASAVGTLEKLDDMSDAEIDQLLDDMLE